MLKRVLIPLLVTILIGSGYYRLRQHPSIAELLNPEFWNQWIATGTAMRLLHAHHADSTLVSYPQLRDRMLHGLLDGLDRHAEYLEKRPYAEFEERNLQEYVGIGIHIEKIRSRVTVIDVFPGGPAAEAGAEPGDQIVEVDGQDTTRASIREVDRLLQGGPGSPVSLVLQRAAVDARRTIELIRRPIDLPSIREARVDEAGIGYLRIAAFGVRTGEEFSRSVADLREQGMRGLIIDLRNNRGGPLSAAIDLADAFLEPGAVIVSTEGRDRQKRRRFRSRKEPVMADIPTVLLVNHQSASASEIVTAALQDYRLAVVVGERTFGKDSVQNTYPLSGGGAAKFTVAHYFSPANRSISGLGVHPDIVVAVEPHDHGRLVLQQRHAGYLTSAEFRREFGFDPIPDEALEVAEAALVGRLRAERARG